jgi:uncharacterized membrane protein/mono/diheme cytochrome c family protein
MILLTISEFIGRFHPVLVHLPIGFLLIAALFMFLSRREKYHSLQMAVGVSLVAGMFSAVAACISGFLLSSSAEYDDGLVATHQWMGIATTIIVLAAYWLFVKKNQYLKWMMIIMVPMIFITGHLGGSLTHGADYLTKGFSSGSNTSGDVKRKPIPNVQEAVVYTDLIQPVLESKCYSCHGANKQKGKLRLDGQEHILKGGKDGGVIVAGKPDESILLERILLSKDNEDHMPPKEKPQLTNQEIDIINWWVHSGAHFTKKVKEVNQPEKIKPLLASLQSGKMNEKIELSAVPAAAVEKADASIIKKLMERGVAINTVAQNSNYLSANLVAMDSITSNDLQLLQSLSKQLTWLKLGFSKITDKQMTAIGTLTSLTRLNMEHTMITDSGLSFIKSLVNLQYLNVSGTKVTAGGLGQLSSLQQLKQIFLYQSGIHGKEYSRLKKIFPLAVIDTGGYVVATLASDTTEVKDPRAKK